MEDVQIIDLIISDINKFLIKNRINPVNVNFRQNNGVPIICEGKISADKKAEVNEYLKKYKDKYEIFKLVMNYHYGSTSKGEEILGKSQLGKRMKNFLKNEAEIMEILKAENVLKLR